MFNLIVEEVRKITLNICSYTSPSQYLYMIYSLSELNMKPSKILGKPTTRFA